MKRPTLIKFLRPELLLVLVVAGCLAALSARSEPSRADLRLTAGGGGSLTLSNDKEGAAILSLGGMRPGDSVTDTVTLGNTGTVPGDLSLEISNLLDTPGPGGGALSGELDLQVRDTTNAGPPATVYAGKISALTPVALGTLAAGDSRVYEFRVSFPDAGPGAEDAYQGSAMSVEFDWTAVNNDADTDPPETSITSGPSGLITDPNPTIAFISDEPGSTFECSLDGGPFAGCSSPATFSGLADGAHTLDVQATDSAGNTDPTPAQRGWTIDATAPTVSLADPGAFLRGIVSLNASGNDSGSGIASLVIQRSPAAGGPWTTIPASWNTSSVADGDYRLRAAATDNAGNSANSSIRNITVDNTAPAVAGSVPEDGEVVSDANMLTVVANENVFGIVNATIDGSPAPAPTVSGTSVAYSDSFGDGPHTLAGDLTDLAGNTRPIRVHFTVWSLAGADYPWVEKNSFPANAMTLLAANGDGEIGVPSGAWSGATAGDWLVVRIDPRPSAAVGGGFQTAGDIYDVTAYWALAGTQVHSFDNALDITIEGGAAQIVPATLVGGAWEGIGEIPGGAHTLPSGWDDGYYKVGTDVHILTLHLSSFSLLKDVQAPTKPGKFSGKRTRKKIVLKWKASTDNSAVAAYLVYTRGKLVRTLPVSARKVSMGRFKATDRRQFQVAARDTAGNVGPKTRKLVIVPALKNLTVARAKTRLQARGLRAGTVRYAHSSSIASGRIISTRSGLAFKGARIALRVSRGSVSQHPSSPSGGTYTGGTGNGSTGASNYGSNYGGYGNGTSFSGGYGVTPPPTPTFSANPLDGSGEDTPTLAGTNGTENVPVEPQSFTSPEEGSSSTLRRLLGLGLLAGAFSAAGYFALRSRRSRVTSHLGTGDVVAPILFWDQRLLQAVTASVRRLARRL